MRKITCSSEPRGRPRTSSRSIAIEHDAFGPEHVHVAVVVDFGLQSRGRDRDHLVAASGERGEQPARMPGA